ncbi:MAG: hypothetical protein NVSMB62_19840 [Acidobacteriaceae bacterium]
MNHLLDTELDREEDTHHGDREISLGPGTILGIFFALALLCGAVFGLGYTMGRRSGQNAVAPIIMSNGSPAILASGAKPTAGSAVPPTLRPAPAGEAPVAPAPVVTRSNVAPSDTIIVSDKLPKAAAAPAQPVATVSAGPVPATTPAGTFMVQIAAVSTQEIADIELAALKKYNYPVVVRHEPNDQLLHIQLGPYATRKDAEAMRQNVLSHGFNAIVK